MPRLLVYSAVDGRATFLAKNDGEAPVLDVPGRSGAEMLTLTSLAVFQATFLSNR